MMIIPNTFAIKMMMFEPAMAIGPPILADP
jgi:hypothetical protein